MRLPLEQPLFLILIPLGLLAVWKLLNQRGGIGFSAVSLLEGMRGVSLLTLERIFLGIFVVASAITLARPVQVVKDPVPVYKQARDISLVVDVSGSMSITDKLPTAKKVITKFVEGRPQDRVALFSFDTEVYLEWPLSSDHQALITRLNDLIIRGGTTISVGIIAALEHQNRFGKSPGAVIVASDGASELRDEEKQQIEALLGRTKLYWIQIGVEPGEEQLSEAFGEYVTSLGGVVYRSNIEDLDEIFSEISRLEASPVVWEQRATNVYRFGFFPLGALLGLLAAAVIELLREV